MQHFMHLRGTYCDFSSIHKCNKLTKNEYRLFLRYLKMSPVRFSVRASTSIPVCSKIVGIIQDDSLTSKQSKNENTVEGNYLYVH